MNKKITLFVLLSFVYSCASLDSSKIAPGYVEAFSTIKNLLFDQSNDQITSVLVNEIPYASLVLKIGKGKPGLLILESVSDLGEIWVSSDKVYLVIKEGRIIKTSGLKNNLTDYKSNLSLKSILLSDLDLNSLAYYSFEPPILNNLRVSTSIEIRDSKSVKLLNQEISLTLIEESVVNKYLGWKFKNQFWLDSKGFVRKSKQYVSPKLPPFYLEVTKKPAL